MSTDTARETFQAALRGALLQAGDPDYERARRLYNGMIDKRPRLIARCGNVADVIRAVHFAREQGGSPAGPRITGKRCIRSPPAVPA